MTVSNIMPYSAAIPEYQKPGIPYTGILCHRMPLYNLDVSNMFKDVLIISHQPASSRKSLCRVAVLLPWTGLWSPTATFGTAYYAIVCHCTTWTFQTCSKMFSSFLTNLQAPEKVCAVSPSCCLGQVCDLLQPPLGTIGTICPVECAGTAPDTCILASWKWGFTEVRWDSRFM